MVVSADRSSHCSDGWLSSRGHGLTGEMYVDTAAKGVDIYLPAASLPGHKEREAKIESLVKRATEWSLLY